MSQGNICILCIANPARSCNCQWPEPAPAIEAAPRLVDELETLKFTGTWDIHYTSVDRLVNPPRCLVRGDGMLVYATLNNGDSEYTSWRVGSTDHGASLPSCSRSFKTAKEAMAWVDTFIVEKSTPNGP